MRKVLNSALGSDVKKKINLIFEIYLFVYRFVFELVVMVKIEMYIIVIIDFGFVFFRWYCFSTSRNISWSLWSISVKQKINQSMMIIIK